MTNPHVMSKYATELDCLHARDSWSAERIASLESQLAAERAMFDRLNIEFGQKERELAALQSRADQDRADAERYRWLRFRTLWEPNCRLKWKCCLTRDELDAAIDATRATQKESEDGK